MRTERKRVSRWGLSSGVGLLAAVLLLYPMTAAFGGSTTKALSTNFTIVNLATLQALGTVDYYQPNGTAWPASFTSIDVAGNYGQQIIAQYLDPTLTAGTGSAVLSSDQQIGAVVQVLARGQIASSGAYSNIAPANKFYIPQIQRQKVSASGTVNSQIAIQSAEQPLTAAIAVTVDFFPYPGSGLTGFQKTGISLQPGAALLYDIADETNLATGWYGSAVVTAEVGKNIVVTSNLFSGSDSLMTFNGFPSTQIGPKWSVPLFTSRLANGLSTPVIVQNLSGGDIPVGGIQMTCNGPSTFTVSNTAIVANNASYAFNPVTDLTIVGGWSGACSVDTSAAPGPYNVVVLVQMRRPGVSAEAAAYEGFLASITDTKVVVPLMSKMQGNGFATVATIQNLSGTDAPVTLTYTPSASYGGSALPIVIPATIPGNGNLNQNLRFLAGVPEIPAGWFGTLVVTGTHPIVAFVQLTNYLGAAGDTLMAHQAFTQPN
jgi:hypothetical protein